MAKKILVLLGHPDHDSYSGAIADRYQAAAETAGNEVHRVNLGELRFDPILRHGQQEKQDLEPDLIDLQDSFRWADHILIVYPNWWVAMPALLKGLFDRFWTQGFAFEYNHQAKQVEGRLTGKTARVIVVSGFNSPFKTWWKFGDYTNEIQYGILERAGIKTAISSYGPTLKVPQERLDRWLTDIDRLGARGS